MRKAILFVALLITNPGSANLRAQTQGAMVGNYTLFTTSFSADGKHVLVGGGGGCWVYSAQKGNLLEYKNHMVRTAAFSHDNSSRYATWGDDNIIRMHDMGDEKDRWTVTRTDGYARQFVFSPDGKTIAASSYFITGDRVFSGFIQMLDVATGKELHRMDYKDEYPVSMSISRDGSHLAVAVHISREKNKIVIYECAGWNVIQNVPIDDGFPNVVSFLNDSMDLIVAGGKYYGPDAEPKRDARIWRADRTAKGYELKRIHQEDVDSYQTAIVSADGSFMIVHNGVGRSQFKRDGNKVRETSWRLAPVFQKRNTTTGELEWTVDGPQSGTTDGLQLSASGKQFLYILGDTAYVASTETGEIMQELVPEVK